MSNSFFSVLFAFHCTFSEAKSKNSKNNSSDEKSNAKLFIFFMLIFSPTFLFFPSRCKRTRSSYCLLSILLMDSHFITWSIMPSGFIPVFRSLPIRMVTWGSLFLKILWHRWMRSSLWSWPSFFSWASSFSWLSMALSTFSWRVWDKIVSLLMWLRPMRLNFWRIELFLSKNRYSLLLLLILLFNIFIINSQTSFLLLFSHNFLTLILLINS